MKIAILGAMDEEVKLIQESLNHLQEVAHSHLVFFTGELHDHEIILVKCGIGKVASAVATTMIIDKFNPDFVVNTGSAGGFDKELNIGDIVISDAVTHHDVDLTVFGYVLGQCAGMPANYVCNEQLIEAAEKSAKQIEGVKVKKGLVCSGDSFVGSDELALATQQKFPTMIAVEMEGAAIAQTAYLMGIPFLVIRSLSDIAGKTSTVSFQAYLEKAAKNSAQLVMGMVKALG
ncbi:5'-methylthioadenosine/adenosylhomocysteine nucleosidase [Brumicola pallidula]|jgi:adenosylhomocysteine nucleosidase|uniref:5'-methylthioadenosine/S-adenosylhomocysteine nucleosidase n=1 Tax=Brumicola pallidula DSM 14239 = ACAM 615 TaxID=1121922 RepID=K7A4P1_9ALTE|nr:5'-methylthioadenosine/adenosylhomocysteine nucleosidase [Glaciecola pallidula]GAC30470.1 5'-methylthioadenosine/S-adenosylhomocysteine nucleosidase [Glaciecola pallidula DSM 14239 = ACAM 615]